ncbi:MAG: glycosyltransferase family 4 protein [Sporomusaceae bacterium]|nr:glycosyltransferase family 4 protein [Sporomusaceae bacterium]
MKVWLVTVGEPLPVDGEDVRLYRTGLMSKMMVDRGHEVLWWTSSFDHIAKKQRCDNDKKCIIQPGLDLFMLHAPSYQANISVDRLINHFGLGRKFCQLARHESKPDIILVSFPTLKLAWEVVKYANGNNIPVVVDVRDLWPDIFLDLLPSWGRWLGRLPLFPLYKWTKLACAGATGIAGVTPDFVEWGLKYAGRAIGPFDRDFPLGYSNRQPGAAQLLAAEQQWAAKGITSHKGIFDICFFGTFGNQLDIETVVEAAKILEQDDVRKFRFIICGMGDKFEYYKSMVTKTKNIIFPGWVSAPEIWWLMRSAKVGLAPYKSTPDYEMSIPNKIIEYLSAGLPIVTSLHGRTEKILVANSCGKVYTKGNPQDLATILREMYDNSSGLSAMAHSANKVFTEKFVAEKVYSDYIDHLEYILETCRAQADSNKQKRR